MSASFSLLAQVSVDPELITFGQVIAGLMVLSMLAGSLTMIVWWGMRLRQGLEMIPTAGRRPLFVPLPVMIFGVGLAATMALLMLKNTSSSLHDGAATVLSSAETSDGPGDLSTEEPAPVIDMVDFGGAGDGESIDENSAEKDSAAAGATASSLDTESQPLSMLYQQLIFFGMIFMMFGASIWLSQLDHSRSPIDSADVTDVISSAATESIFPGESRFPDLDAPPEFTAAHTTLISPYSAPDSNAAEPWEEFPAVVEKWHAATELRFAFETVLAAYLPTTAIKIALDLIVTESPSHPFLEMLDDGISWTIVLLIGFVAMVVAPVVEELLYRVTILGGIMQRRSLAAGWIVSSVLFAFAHGFPDSLALLPLAFAIGYTYIKRRSYRTVVLVHFLFNTFNMAVAGLTLL